MIGKPIPLKGSTLLCSVSWLVRSPLEYYSLQIDPVARWDIERITHPWLVAKEEEVHVCTS